MNWHGVIAAGWASVLALGAWDNYAAESRAVRDFLGQTPFYDVVVHQTITNGQSITVWGEMKKRRCERTGLTVYTRHDGGPLVPAEFSTNEHPSTPHDRPATPLAQKFGPWTITSSIDEPDHALMFVTHRCPDGKQTNLVFDVKFGVTE